MRPTPRLLIVALCCVATLPVQAATVTQVDIRGLDEAMTGNVRTSLSLVDAIGKDVSGRRLAYLVREAEAETREALEPFGYYSPTITVERTRSEDGAVPVTVTVSVTLGTPVRVRNADVGIDGDAGNDRYLNRELDGFRPQAGDVFEHAAYEASKARITRRLAERGYFDADFVQRKVEVTRADHAADIVLRWNSGDRYDMGVIGFNQAPRRIIRDSLLDKLVYWEQGEYYHQGRLDRLRKSLVALDYFSRVEIEPHPEQAVDGRVPVTVNLTAAKRDIYTAGLSYGTDSGGGVRLGLERRYVNDRGHKLLGQVDWAEHRKTATAQYRIPAFKYLDGWYTASAQAADEQTDFVDARRLELVASRSGEINDRWTAVASLHALRERWRFFSGDPALPVEDYRYASLLFPSLRGEYIDADDRLYPRAALGGTALLRGGVRGIGSEASFVQLHASARWFRGLGARSRLIVRGELGHTFTDALVDIPLSLRFFAGGDRSVRGYEWREIGPRVRINGSAFALGAKNVVTGSVEYERYFNGAGSGGAWGGAVFVDTGSAFDTAPAWRTGIGVGLRWRSPVGPVRIDVGHGLDDPESSFTLHFNIGADL